LGAANWLRTVTYRITATISKASGMSILSWLKNLWKPKSNLTAAEVEKRQDALKADVGGTLLIRDSANTEVERLSD